MDVTHLGVNLDAQNERAGQRLGCCQHGFQDDSYWLGAQLASARVSLLLPPKKGPASFNNGSISLVMPLTSSCALSFASSAVLAKRALNQKLLTLVNHASTKKAIRALVKGPLGSDEAGRRWDGYASARNCATTADSVTISPL